MVVEIEGRRVRESGSRDREKEGERVVVEIERRRVRESGSRDREEKREAEGERLVG